MVRTSTAQTQTPTVEGAEASTESSVPKRTSAQGRVKWFNAQSGYGFIAKDKDPDLFVHHSALSTRDDQFRYLVEGEYVEYGTDTMEDGRSTAVDVTGIGGGPLMCETRQQRRDADQERVGGRHADRQHARQGKPTKDTQKDDPVLWQVIKAQLQEEGT